MLLITTHSVEDSGLLEKLAAAFHEDHPDIRVMTTAVGSGAALELGRRGDGDLLLTHDPVGERRFMDEGHGTAQGPVMENIYLLVGPANDPAGIAGLTDIGDALRRLADSQARFLSRGDDSGTHRKERALWESAGLTPWSTRPPWYMEAGLGMAETLQVGDQMEAYLLTDDGTYRHLGGGVRLIVIVDADPQLLNPYVYTVPRRQRNPDGARIVADWLVGPGQDIIATYGTDRFGTALFRPIAEMRSQTPWAGEG